MKSLRLGGIVTMAVLGFFTFSASALAADAATTGKLADAHLILQAAKSTVITGEVKEVMKWQYATENQETSHAIVLKIAGTTGDCLAYMGPVRFNEQVGNVFAVGDKLEIEGTWAMVNDTKVLITTGYGKPGERKGMRDASGKLGEIKK